MRAKKYENGGPSKKGDQRTDAQILSTGNVPFSMLSRERQAYKNKRAEAGNAA